MHNAPKVKPISRLQKSHGKFDNAGASVDSSSDFMRNKQLSAGSNMMAHEKEKDLSPTGHLLKRNKHLNPRLLSQEIKQIKSLNNQESHPHNRASLPSSPQTQSLSQSDFLINPSVPVKGLSESFHEKLGQTFATNTENRITDTFDALHSGNVFSNISTVASSGANGAAGEKDDWNLSMVSILSTSDKEPQQQAVPSPGWSGEEIGAVFIIALMVPFILCSNLLVILSIARFRRLQIPTNYFITSLAFVDVLVALATPFMIMVEVFQLGAPGTNGGGSGALLCLLPNRILMMTCGVSLLTLATIAYDRHTALVSPLDYVVIMTSRRVGVLVLSTWIYSAVVVWFPLLAGWHDSPTQVTQCSADLLHGRAHALFLSAIFLPSCVVILVCYARIFSLAHHHAQAIAAVESAVHRRLQVKFMIKDAKYAKTLALVIGVFLTLWLPYLVSMFAKLMASVTLSIWVQTYLVLVAVLNSGINPWIYAFKNKEFRHAFNRLYHEVFLEHLCLRRFGRKMSLAHASGCSSTPRLSITDSRMGIAAVESGTLENMCEKLQRSLDSLDRFEKYYDGRLNEPLPRSYRSLPKVTTKIRNYRQTLSCSDLHDTEEMTSILPRSLSVEILPNVGDELLGDSTGTKQRDIQQEQSVDQLNLKLLPMKQSDVLSSLANDQSYSSTSILPFQHVTSPTCLSTHSTSDLLLISKPVISQSSMSKSDQMRVNVHRCKDSETLSLSLPHTQTRIACNRQSTSIPDIIRTKKLITAPIITDIDSGRCKETVCFVNEITFGSSHTESDVPQNLNFSTDSSNSQAPTSSTEEVSLSRFTRADLCRGFYPEPSSLSCTLELRVP